MQRDSEVFRVEIAEGDGLFIAQSKDLPGLFVADKTLDAVVNSIPGVIKVILKVKRDLDYYVLKARIQDDHQRAWVAIPAFIAEKAFVGAHA